MKILLLIHSDLNVSEFLKSNSYYSRIYILISEIYKKNEFTETEVLFLMNFLLNIATESGFHFTIEKYLFYEHQISIYDKSKSIVKHITLIEEKYKKVLKYLHIKNPHYIEMILLFMYELKLNENIRNFYFIIFTEIVVNCAYNSQLIAKEVALEKLFIMLRIEFNFSLKCLLATFLINILRENMDVSRLKTLIQTMRYNYYWNDVVNMFAKLKDEKYKANFFDHDNYYLSLKLLFNVMQKIVNM